MKANCRQYVITDDKSLILPTDVKRLLDTTYWAAGRDLETIARTIENSVCTGVFLGATLVAFARAVTDKAVFAWIADMVVSEPHRGKGLGKRIMQFIQDHPDIPDSLQLLRTRDAHGLYERYGFSGSSEFMSK